MSMQVASFHPTPQRPVKFALVVGDVMTKNPYTIPPTETMARACGMMWAHQVRHLPVVENGRVRGMVCEHDLRMARLLRELDPGNVVVESVMDTCPGTVQKDAFLTDVVRRMQLNHWDAVLVLRDDELVGVFTVTDALRELADRVEQETVGAV